MFGFIRVASTDMNITMVSTNLSTNVIIGEPIDQVVWSEEPYIIIFTPRLFSNGYNCYREEEANSGKFKKINNRMGWFTSLDAAKEFIEEDKKSLLEENRTSIEGS